LRRLGANVYDTFLLCGLLFVASIPLVFMSEEVRQGLVVENLIRLYLVGVCFTYFNWFWRHGGQTLGMRAWKITLLPVSGENLKLGAALIRFLVSVLSLGIGHIWSLFDRDQRALQDIASRTWLMFTPAPRSD